MTEAIATPEDQGLVTELERARERLDALVCDLRSIDGELEALSTERQQYRLLGDACVALEELAAMGAAGLFWGDRVSGADAGELLRGARSRLDGFEKQLGEIEDRRQAVVDEIALREEDVEILEDRIFEARRREEMRKLEWVIEREMGPLPDRPLVMPWARGGEDDRRFRKALGVALLLCLLLGLLFPMIDLPLPDRWEEVEVPERYTQLLKEEIPIPPAPVVEETPEELPEEEETPPEEVVAEETEPMPNAEEAPKPSAESKGILAFREKFSGLADMETPDRLGAQARISSEGEAASGRPERSMVTTQAPGSSGGINLSSLSRDVGGGGSGQIEGVQIARATSTIGGGTGQDRPLAGGPATGRTDEEIQIVFDRHKAALYRLYNRELRRDPTLRGQMILRIRIEPDGSVSLCELQSSDMKAPDLARQVLARVRAFDFGAKEVPPVTILYPIDFLPAT